MTDFKTIPEKFDRSTAPAALRYGSVCSGIEAASVAWEPLGWKASFLSEIDRFPRAVLSHHYPKVPLHGDFTSIQAGDYDPIDLLVGGTPCQSFSVAGLRGGLADDRGNLALEYLKLAQRLRPKWLVWENVPGVLSSAGGRDFGAVLGGLVELGYGFAYRVLDAQHFGVPQRRRRVFVVACLGDWRAAAEVLSLREGLRGYLETGNKKRKGSAADAGASVEAGDQGVAFRKSKRACSTTDNETWVPADASNTLNNFDLGDTRTTHAVVQPVAWTQNQREEVRLLGDKVGAIALPGTHQTNYIAEPVHQMPGSVAPTIGASGPPYSRTGNERVEAEALAVTFQPVTQSDVAGPLDAHYYKGPGSRQGGEREYVAHPPAMAVRRLTPVECERLQGFPDNWSRISWKGKPEEECPDGPRYKACGNSMAVPVMAHIGRRIAEVDATFSNPTNNA